MQDSVFAGKSDETKERNIAKLREGEGEVDRFRAKRTQVEATIEKVKKKKVDIVRENNEQALRLQRLKSVWEGANLTLPVIGPKYSVGSDLVVDSEGKVKMKGDGKELRVQWQTSPPELNAVFQDNQTVVVKLFEGRWEVRLLLENGSTSSAISVKWTEETVKHQKNGSYGKMWPATEKGENLSVKAEGVARETVYLSNGAEFLNPTKTKQQLTLHRIEENTVVLSDRSTFCNIQSSSFLKQEQYREELQDTHVIRCDALKVAQLKRKSEESTIFQDRDAYYVNLVDRLCSAEKCSSEATTEIGNAILNRDELRQTALGSGKLLMLAARTHCSVVLRRVLDMDTQRKQLCDDRGNTILHAMFQNKLVPKESLWSSLMSEYGHAFDVSSLNDNGHSVLRLLLDNRRRIKGKAKKGSSLHSSHAEEQAMVNIAKSLQTMPTFKHETEIKAALLTGDAAAALSLFRATSVEGLNVCEFNIHAVAAASNHSEEQLKFLKQLLRLGANPNAMCNGGCALHMSVSPAVVVALIQGGADPNARHAETGQTPLHLHCSDEFVAYELLRAGAITTLSDNVGKSPLEVCDSEYSRQNMVRKAKGERLRNPVNKAAHAQEDEELANLVMGSSSSPLADSWIGPSPGEAEKLLSIALERHSQESSVGAAVDLVQWQKLIHDVPAWFAGSDWEVCLTKQAKEVFVRLPIMSRLDIWRALSSLAKGERRSNRDSCCSGCPGVKLFRTKVTACGKTMVWENAIEYSSEKGCYMDTVVVWSPWLEEREYDKAVRSVTEAHARGRMSSVQRLLKRVELSEGRTARLKDKAASMQKEGKGTVQPNAYALVKEELVDNSDGASGATPPRSSKRGDGHIVFTPPALDTEDGLTVQKYFSLTPAVALALVQPRADTMLASLPFRCDEAEHLRITDETVGSTLLLGRSGTGKTTIALHRLFEHRNQCCLFVTANTQLVDGVHDSFRAMSLEDSILPRRRPTDLKNLPPSPTFLTLQEFLVAVDGTLPVPFLPRKPGGTQLLNPGSMRDGRLGDSGAGAQSGLSKLDDIYDFSSSSTDGLAAAEEIGNEGGRAPAARGGKAVGGKGASVPTRMVDYTAFAKELWPKMMQKTQWTKEGYDPSSVFSEIFSQIKGSPGLLGSSSARQSKSLTKDEYEALGRKQAANFEAGSASSTASNRDMFGTRADVYVLYEKYEDVKKEGSWFDLPDMLWHVNAQIDSCAGGWMGSDVLSIFVDEVQDMNKLELQLLLRVCKDKNSCFMSGDSCQTIAKGVQYRFSDLTSFFWEFAEQDKSVVVPPLSQLRTNYRTHQGVLGAANTAVDLMLEYFPSTMDKLEPERGFFRGPEPVLLLEPIEQVGLVLSSGSASSNVEFGAQQVVIVRSEQAAAQLKAVTSSNGVKPFADVQMLTVGQTKGLEYDDVIIVDFFKDSPASAEDWMVILPFMEKNGISLDPADHDRSSFTSFNTVFNADRHSSSFSHRKHLLLNDEFKLLYTAITRAKRRLFFVDSDVDKRSPVWALLQARGVAKHKHVLEVIRNVVSSSDSGGWEKMGKSLLTTGNLNMAMDCFLRVKTDAGNKLADEVQGQLKFRESQLEAERKMKRKLLCEAGDLFIRAGKWCLAVRCCLLGKQWTTAKALLPLVDDANLAVSVREFCKAI
jgi:hypothetical protein